MEIDFIFEAAKKINTPVFFQTNKKKFSINEKFYLFVKTLNVENFFWIKKVDFEIQLKYSEDFSHKQITEFFDKKIYQCFLEELKQKNIFNIKVDGFLMTIFGSYFI